MEKRDCSLCMLIMQKNTDNPVTIVVDNSSRQPSSFPKLLMSCQQLLVDNVMSSLSRPKLLAKYGTF